MEGSFVVHDGHRFCFIVENDAVHEAAEQLVLFLRRHSCVAQLRKDRAGTLRKRLNINRFFLFLLCEQLLNAFDPLLAGRFVLLILLQRIRTGKVCRLAFLQDRFFPLQLLPEHRGLILRSGHFSADDLRLQVIELQLDACQNDLLELADRYIMRFRAFAVRVAHAVHPAVPRARKRPAAGAALHKPLQHHAGGFPLRAVGISLIAPHVGFDRLLRRIEIRLGKDGLMRTGDEHGLVVPAIGFVVVVRALRRPAHAADVDRVCEHVAHGAVLPCAAALRLDAEAVQLFRDGHDRAAGKEIAVDHADDLGLLRLNDELSVFIGVADRRGADGAALPHALGHAAAHFGAEVHAVKRVEPLDDALDQPAERPLDQRLGDADDVDAVLLFEQRLIDDAFLLIAGEAREFPDEDDLERARLLLRRRDHAQEAGPLLGAAAADAVVAEDEFLRDHDVVLLRVVLDQLDLAFGAVIELVVGRDADVRRADFLLFHSTQTLSGRKCQICMTKPPTYPVYSK